MRSPLTAVDGDLSAASADVERPRRQKIERLMLRMGRYYRAWNFPDKPSV
jgi:hypothetical protein